MYQEICGSLFRQHKGLLLLADLLEEEYGYLRQRDTDHVAALEFSLQELIRQLAVEKSMVIRRLGGAKLLEYAAGLTEEDALALRELYVTVDIGEQSAARQASRNAELSLALLDQSTRNLKALAGQIIPSTGDTYCRRGGMQQASHPQAALISGRL